MRELTLTDTLLAAFANGDPAAPRFTYYNDDPFPGFPNGQRMSLSTVTLVNWAAKAANMFRDQYGLEPDSSIAVRLPAHWQTAGVLLGAWWAGLTVEYTLPGVPALDTQLAVVTEPDALAAEADEVLAVSLDPFARPLTELPVGIDDYVSTVRIHPDAYSARDTAGDPFPGLTLDEVRAATRTAGTGLTDSDRVLTTTEWRNVDGVISGLLAPLAAGAAIVHVAAGDPEPKATAERVTARR